MVVTGPLRSAKNILLDYLEEEQRIDEAWLELGKKIAASGGSEELRLEGNIIIKKMDDNGRKFRAEARAWKKDFDEGRCKD